MLHESHMEGGHFPHDPSMTEAFAPLYAADPVVPETSSLKAVVIGGKGKFGGKSMGEVAVESPSSLDYFASSYRGHNNLIPAAARVLLSQALPKAG